MSMYDVENPVQAWDMEEYSEGKLQDFWREVDRLPVGSVVATGFLDDGLVYFRREPSGWVVAQVDNPNTEDMFPVGMPVSEAAEIDAGGDIELAYVVEDGEGVL